MTEALTPAATTLWENLFVKKSQTAKTSGCFFVEELLPGNAQLCAYLSSKLILKIKKPE